MKDNFKIKITLKYIGIYYSLQFVIRANEGFFFKIFEIGYTEPWPVMIDFNHTAGILCNQSPSVKFLKHNFTFSG